MGICISRSNQDAISVGASLGVSKTNSVTYDANRAGSKALFRGLSVSVASYRGSGQGKMENLYNQQSYNAALDPNLVQDPSIIVKPSVVVVPSIVVPNTGKVTL